MIKTLRKIKWEKIKVGEVFAFRGCWSILYKISTTEAMFLESTEDWMDRNDRRGEIYNYQKRGGFGTIKIDSWGMGTPFGRRCFKM